MNFFERNLGRFFRKKMDEHEFAFDENAWEQMAEKLDADHARTTRSNARLNLFLFLSLALGFITFAFFYSLAPQSKPIDPNSIELDAISGAAERLVLEKASDFRQIDNFGRALGAPNSLTFENKESLFFWGDLISDLCCYGEIFMDSDLSSPITQIKKNTAIGLSTKIKEINQEIAPEKVYVHFDKNIVQQGEDLWFKVYVRDANTFKPSAKSTVVYAQLVDPDGKVKKTLSLIVKNGGAEGDFYLGKNAKEGKYKVLAFTNWQRNQKEFYQREFVVLPNDEKAIELLLDFEQAEVYAGNMVIANLLIKSQKGKSLDYIEFEYEVKVEGAKGKRKKGRTGKGGQASIRYELPNDLKTENGTVLLDLSYRGKNYAIKKNFGIKQREIDLQFLPEGGELLAGVDSKVAFKAVNSLGKSQIVIGAIKDSKGEKVVDFQTAHAGMGQVNFTPKAGENYYATLHMPLKNKEKFYLPEVKEKGYAIRVAKQGKGRLNLNFNTPDIESVLLIGRAKGEVIFSKQIVSQAGDNSISVPLKQFPMGIAQFTLFDSKGLPQSERLVFVNKDQQLKVSITSDKDHYRPREKVTMTVKVSDKEGNPVPGNFSLAVRDKNLEKFTEDKQANIAAYMLLESDLTGFVEDPNYYFDEKNILAQKHLDLLLLTQGYRRFAWKEILYEPIVDRNFINESGLVQGQVLDINNQPLKNALVKVVDTDLKQNTGTDGEFCFADLDLRNAVMLHIEASGYGKNWYPVFAYSENLRLGLNEYPMRARDMTSYSEQYLPPLYPQRPRLVKVEPKVDIVTEVVEVKPATKEFAIIPPEFKTVKKKVIVKPSDNNSPVEFREVTEQILIKKARVEEKEMPPVFKEIKRQVFKGKIDEEKLKKQVTKTLVQEPKPIRNPNDLRSWGFDQREINKENSNFVLIPRPNSSYKNNRLKNQKGSRFISKKILSSPASAQVVTTPAQYKTVEQQVLLQPAYIKEVLVPAEYKKVLKKVLLKDKSNSAAAIYDTVWENVLVKAAHSSMEKVEAEYKIVEERIMTKAPSYKMVADPVSYKMIRKKVSVEEYNAYAEKFKYGFYRAREFYLPKYNKGKNTETDRRSTLFWEPNLSIGLSGTKTISFYNSDAITDIIANLEGFSDGGGLAAGTYTYKSAEQVLFDAKIPELAVKGDRISLPITIANQSKLPLDGRLMVSLPAGFEMENNALSKIKIAAEEVHKHYIDILLTDKASSGEIKLNFATQESRLNYIAPIAVSTPKTESLTVGGSQLHNTFLLHETSQAKAASLKVYAGFGDYLSSKTKLGSKKDLQEILKYSQLQLAMLDYLGDTQKSIKDKTLKQLDYSYRLIKDFEVQYGGFERFGKQPANEILTAEAIRCLAEMKQYIAVEQALIDRSATWLLSLKTSKGSWQIVHPQLDWTDSRVFDAYILWSLTEAGYTEELEQTAQLLYKIAKQTNDDYLKALMANTLIAKQDIKGTELLQELLLTQTQDAAWAGKSHGAFLSRGAALKEETTALVVLGLQRTFTAEDRIKMATAYLYGQNPFLGEKSVLSYRALAKTEQQQTSEFEGGNLLFMVNGTQVLSKKIEKNKPAQIPGLEKYIKGESVRLEVWIEQANRAVPFELNISYPEAKGQKEPLEVNSKIDTNRLKVGETLHLSISLSNKSKNALPLALAKIPLPTGSKVQDWQLNALLDQGKINAYELKEGNLLLYKYWLGGASSVAIDLDLKAQIPGVYQLAGFEGKELEIVP